MNTIANTLRTKKPSNFVDTIKPNKYIRDALLCEIKYLIPHIIISPVPLLHSSGIIHNMFTSNIIHWNNNLSTLNEPKTHAAKMIK